MDCLKPPTFPQKFPGFSPQPHETDWDLTLPPIETERAYGTGKGSQSTNLAGIYHEYRNDTQLCPHCDELDARAFLSGAVPEFPKLRIGTLAEIRRKSYCWLCWLIYRICRYGMSRDLFRKLYQSNEAIQLEQVPGRWVRKALLEGSESSQLHYPCVILGLARHSWDEVCDFLNHYDLVYNKHPSVDGKTTIRRLRNFEIEYGLADYEMIRSWLSVWEENLCPSSLSAPISPSNSFRIHLIDVTTRSIIVSNIDVNYIALSYVWGQQNGVGENTQAPLGPFDLAAQSSRPLPKFLPPKVAQTIEDAMFVVAKLGKRFLWVDAYCIEQGDPSEREHMINNMHRVYENACLTICAMSSSTSESGLAGVSHFFSRRSQFTSYTGTESLIAHGNRNVYDDLEESPWIKRGWTLQEAVMSQRLLCFGESGLTLWSREELFHDYITFDTSEKRWPMKSTRSGGSSPPFSFEFTPSDSWGFDTYVRLVKDYTRRKLSVASDASRAIASLLTRISSDTGTNFIFGLPAQDIVQALLWEGSQLRRNGEFPSWSWLGWQGDISYRDWLSVSYPGRLSNGRNFFKHRQDLYSSHTYHIVPFSAAAFPSLTHRSGSLTVKSQLVRFKINLAVRDGDLEHFPSLRTDAEPDYWEESVGDKWELLSGDGEPLLSDGEQLNGVRFGFQGKCGFYVGADTSNRITHAKLETVDLVLLQRWTEIDLEAGGIQSFSRFFGDRVWLMVLLRNPDGTAERAGLVHLPYKHWTNANPRSATVCLV